MRNRAKLLTRLLGIGVLVYILFHVDIPKVASVLKRTQWGPFILAFLLLVPLYGIKALRWRRILAWQNIRYSRRDALLAYLSANFIALVTPGRIGEAVKAFYIKQDTGLGIARALPSVILDRFFDLYVVGAIASVGMARLSVSSRLGTWRYLLLGLLVLIPLVLLNASARGYFLRKVKDLRLGGRWNQAICDLSSELCAFRARDLVLPFVQTIAAYGIMFWASQILALAAGLPLSFLSVAMFVSIANAISFIPISVAGLGTRDACFIFLFSTVGRPKEEALAFSFLFFCVFVLGGGLMGFLAYSIKPVHLDLARLLRPRKGRDGL